MNQTLSWGILGTGRIAGIFADGLSRSKTGRLVAVASRDQTTADRFGRSWNVRRCYAKYDRLLADPDVQAVYISTPHLYHAEWSIKAANAGKHLLCEKPLGMNLAEAQAIIEAARRNDVFLMEAFMYRFHPQISRLIDLLRSGVIGRVSVIQATFAFKADFRPESRLLHRSLGGGGILDVGCYCTSIARLIAGVAAGGSVAEPTKVTGVGHLGTTGVDEYALATLAFPQGIVAQLFCGVRVEAGASVTIYGSDGSISLPMPFLPPVGKHVSLLVKRDDEKDVRKIFVETVSGLYDLEADAVARSLELRQAPEMNWENTLGNMRTLDLWRATLGLTYEGEG